MIFGFAVATPTDETYGMLVYEVNEIRKAWPVEITITRGTKHTNVTMRGERYHVGIVSSRILNHDAFAERMVDI